MADNVSQFRSREERDMARALDNLRYLHEQYPGEERYGKAIAIIERVLGGHSDGPPCSCICHETDPTPSLCCTAQDGSPS